MDKQWILVVLALLAGAFVPVQTGANALLSKHLGHGMFSTLVVFVIAGIASFFILIYLQPEIPSVQSMKQIPLYSWITGGILGALYIYLLIYLAPKLGMAQVVGFVIAGQLIMSLIFDHFGLMDSIIKPFNIKRAFGCILMIIGLFIIKKY